MNPIDYVGTKLISVRQIEGGVEIRPLASENAVIRLTPDEWVDLVQLAVMFARRAKGKIA